MTFDLTTLLFQLANFALLVVLLRIFLYRPVLKVMDEREELTAAPLREARSLAEEAEQEREALRQERAALEQERLQRLAETAQEADGMRQRRLEELDREASTLRAAASESIARDIERVADRLRSSLAQIVVDEVRQTVAATTGSELEAPAWERFEQQLRALSAAQHAELAAAARAAGVKIVTPRPLSRETAETVREVLTETLEASNVTFETDPELLLGVALEAGGVRLDNSAAGRLESLESTFAAVLRGDRS